MQTDIATSQGASPQGEPGRRVAVVGAGPGGLSASIALHRAGYHVRLFERHAAIKALGGAILLNAIGLDILRGYGVNIDELYTPASITEYRRFDGHVRARWKTDDALLKKLGIGGWISGTMRSDVYKEMLAVLPDTMVVPSAELEWFSETPQAVTLHFSDGTDYEADLLIGADGIHSVVREQLWGPSEVLHLGIAAWLGWAQLDGVPRTHLVAHHNDLYQAGYAPFRYRGQDCMQYWVVEPCTPTQPEPTDPHAYLKARVGNFAFPVPQLLDATEPDHLFRWVIKGREPIKTWSRGRATLLGDAAHPSSPYSGYGAGMAIEDGFFLGEALAGQDLRDLATVTAALTWYEDQRVEYCNKVTGFARTLGKVFHTSPWPLRRVRDFMLDHTKIPDRLINKGQTDDAQKLLRAILAARERRSRRIQPQRK